MYERSVMLKPNYRKTHIVSRLFDTIHKIAAPDEPMIKDAETVDEIASTYVNEYSLSVPNEQMQLKIRKEKPLMICTYQVRTDGLYPFILFLLQKPTAMGKEASFATLTNVSPKKGKYAAIAYMQSILPRAIISYAGFYETAENTILILCAEEPMMVQPDYVWAIPFEILNKKRIMNYTVDPAVMAFFMANPAFITVRDKANRLYEAPMIGYTSHQHTCPETEMDIYRETRDPAFGKCYYIDIDIPSLADTSIMRIAFFAGKMVLKKEKSYDSLLCSATHCYIIQNYDQHVVLSVFNATE
jgi:hypothetical protein